MYGQFHHAQSLRTAKTFSAEKNFLLATKSKQKKVMTLVSFLILTLLVSSASFAGPSKPQLPRGNGNAQGR